MIAVLTQSLFFGVILFSLGGFSTLSDQPYHTMRMRLQDKNNVISGVMNHIYLEGMRLKRQIQRNAPISDIHTQLIDTLNRTDYLSAVVFLDVYNKEGIYFIDSEPQEYSATASDINCLIGTSQAETGGAMSNRWKKNFDGGDYEKVKAFTALQTGVDRWFYDREKNAFYFMVYAENRNHMVFLQVREEELRSLLEEDSGGDGMQFWIGGSEGEFYSGEKEWEDSRVTVTDSEESGREVIAWEQGDQEYTGYRERIKIYGMFQEGTGLYVGVLSRKDVVEAPVRELLDKIIIAYLFSIAVCFVACWRSTDLILKPLKNLLQDIRSQEGRMIRFQESRAVEINSICHALHDMTKRLEESYLRFHFAMEEVEQNLGSFSYHRDTGMTHITHSLKTILCLPASCVTEKEEITEAVWNNVRAGLTPFPELGAYVFADDNGEMHCVSFKTRQEERGIFGVVIDKTAEYKKISQLRFASEHDFLTKLHNASYMKAHGSELLEKHRGKCNAVVFCDLDNLKYVNDHYGHEMGDAYIRTMAARMRDCAEILQKTAGVEAIAARISGDEFAMFLAGFDTKEAVREAVVSLYRDERTICLPDGAVFAVRASIGFAYEGEETDTIEKLLKCADAAMYFIKKSCKNSVAVYTGEGQARQIDLR